MMLVALVLSVFCATTAFGQKTYKAELDDSMFKAWTSNEPGAQVDPEPATEPKADNPFKCENNFYKEVSAYGCVWGSSSVYYLWYADLTGTKTITVKGTPGMSIRMMLNREPYVEGGAGDADGGAYVERIQSIGEDGTVVFDVSDLTYVHLNAIKVPGGGTAGVVSEIILDGTVKPVTGILSVINNGDAEGDDLSSFPVSLDGPNNGGTANDKPEVVDGGVSGKCFKVTSWQEPTETWHTQFYIKADEVMAKGSKWVLKMAIKASVDNTKITTSAQAQPRTWKGDMGMGDTYVGTEWKEFTWTGEIGVDDFQSIAFDLNNGDEVVRNTADDNDISVNRGVTFYFDNIEFGYDLGGSNPMSMVSATYGMDVIEVNLQGATNIAEMVKAADGKKVVFPNECVNVTWNGKPANPLSVEGRPNGNLYIFLSDIDGDESAEAFAAEDAVVKIAFTNPADQQIQFTAGKWAGEPVPDFTGMICAYNEELGSGEFESSVYGGATLVSADPEDGSFNLDPNMTAFTLTFDQNIDITTVQATLGKEALTASIDETKRIVTLTRTATGALSGVQTLYVDRADNERGWELESPLTLTWSFGPTVIDENDQPEVLYQSDFTTSSESPEANAAGWLTTADDQAGLQPASSSGGNRLQHGQTGYAADVLYLAQRSAAAGIALYGLDEEHKLTLAGGKTYHLTLKSAQWDAYPASGSNRSLRAQILTEDAVSTEDGSIIDESGILGEQFQVVDGRVKEDKEFTAFDIAFTPESDGNFVIRLVAGDLNGNPAGYNDGNAIADVKVEYIPNVMGIVEIKALETALEAAKATLEENGDDRFAGEAYNKLDNTIKEYDGKTMTAPSAYNNAVSELNAAAKALNDHAALCKAYDALPERVYNIWANNAETKFNVTEVYAKIAAAVQKYEMGMSEDETFTYKVIYDDAELTAAKDELTNLANLGDNMFTVGKSNNGDAGIKVLVDRIRQGAEALQNYFEVAEDDELIEAADNAMTDDDALADAIKNRVKKELYGKLKDGDNSLFDVVENEDGEEVASTVDMTVFVKNPNTYALLPSNGVNEDNTPGWTQISGEGFGNMGLYGSGGSSWGNPRNIEGLPEDCAFTVYHSKARVEQTITDLPAGIYTVTFLGTDWGNQMGDLDEETGEYPGQPAEGFVYAKLSDTPAPEEGEDEDRDIHFAATATAEYAGLYQMNRAHDLEGLVITDGQLTIGLQTGGDSQYFFGDVKLTLTAPATGFDYATAYNNFVDGVETAKTAKVRSFELYDLNGRRVNSARKGLVIIKKHMSDGTVKTQKIVK